MSGGANGATIPVVTAIELHAKVASYRTALVAMLAMVKRDGGFMSWGDQMLLNEIERLVDAK